MFFRTFLRTMMTKGLSRPPCLATSLPATLYARG